MPIRIYDLAKEVKRSNAEVVAMLEKEGFGTLSPSSNMDDITADKIRAGVKAEIKAAKDAALAAAPTVPFNVTVQGLGDQLGVGAPKILEVLATFGITKASPTQRLSPDAATKIAKKLGILVRALRSEEETVAEREAVAKAKAEKENLLLQRRRVSLHHPDKNLQIQQTNSKTSPHRQFRSRSQHRNTIGISRS